MKKGIKTVLGCLLGATLLAGCSVSGNLQGTTIEEVKDGTNEYDWRVNYVHIEINEGVVYQIFPSNHEGAYIYEVNYFSTLNNHQKDKDGNYGVMRAYIRYYDAFSWGDDLEVFFVLSNNENRIVSNTYHSDLPWFDASIELPDECMNGYFIDEIWVKCID